MNDVAGVHGGDVLAAAQFDRLFAVAKVDFPPLHTRQSETALHAGAEKQHKRRCQDRTEVGRC